MSDFKSGQLVTDGVTIVMVCEPDKYEYLNPPHDRLPWGHIMTARRGPDFQMGRVLRKVDTLRRATCDEVFNSCVHGKIYGPIPCEWCEEKGIKRC